MEKSKKQINIYKLMTNISLYLMIAIIVIVVLSAFKFIKLNLITVELLLILVVLCVGTWLAMPWARKLHEEKKLKIISIVFLSLILLCALLWIIGVFVGGNLYTLLVNTINKSTEEQTLELAKRALNSARYIKWISLFSIQFVVANYIAGGVLKYGKEKIPYQAIMYFCVLFIDLFLIMFLFMLKIDVNNAQFQLRNISFFKSKLVWALFVLSLLLLMITTVFNNRFEKRKLKENLNKNIREERSAKTQEQSQPIQDSIEEKLAKIEKLLNSGLITKEEYEQKRAEIIKEL